MTRSIMPVTFSSTNTYHDPVNHTSDLFHLQHLYHDPVNHTSNIFLHQLIYLDLVNHASDLSPNPLSTPILSTGSVPVTHVTYRPVSLYRTKSTLVSLLARFTILPWTPVLWVGTLDTSRLMCFNVLSGLPFIFCP